MSEPLPVHLNRESLHSLEVPVAFEADGSFDVLLVNHGEAIHVHLHIDDALSETASLDANNHYVAANSERAVRVTVHDEGEVRGKLKVVTSYGAETRYVDVDLVEPEATEDPVQVDESLARPQPTDPPDDEGGALDRIDAPVAVLGGLALLLAVAVAISVPTTEVRVGSVLVVLAVLVGFLVAFAE